MMACGSGGASINTHSPPGPSGATIHAFVSASHSGSPSISTWGRLSAVFALEAGDARELVDPDHGGRVASLIIGGVEVLVTDGMRPFDWGIFPMAPFAGRVRRGEFRIGDEIVRLPINLPPHAIHGTVVDAHWSVAEDGTLVV